MRRLRTLLVNDHHRLLDALERILADDERIEVIGRFLSVTAAGAEIARFKPDLLLIGIPSAGGDVFNFIRDIKSQSSAPTVILLIPYDLINYRIQAEEAGVDCCVVQGEAQHQLEPIIEELSERLDCHS